MSATSPLPPRGFRAALAVALTAVIALLSAACTGGAAERSPDQPIRLAGITNASSDLLYAYAEQNDLFRKNGLNVEVTSLPSVTVLNQEFAAGKYDVIPAGPENLAALAARGVPVSVLGSSNSSLGGVVVTRKGSGINSLEDLRGKRLTGTASSAMFMQVKAAGEKWHGLTIGKDVSVVQAQTGTDGLTQLAAGSADAAVLIETAVSEGLRTNPDLQVVYNVNDDYKQHTGQTLWQVVFGIYQKDAIPAGKRTALLNALSEAARAVQADPAMADALAVQKLHTNPGVYQEAISSGRLRYEVAPLDPPMRESLTTLLDMAKQEGTVQGDVPEGFMA